jgi:hypothetical protein
MGMRAYWGDLLLPKIHRKTEVSDVFEAPQIHKGIDRASARILSINRNWSAQLAVRTFWSPDADYTAKAHEAYEAAFRAAVLARCEVPYPLFEVEDADMQVLSSVTPITTTTPHGWSTGNVVLVRRLGVGLYTYGAITVTGASTFTIVSQHAIAIGDKVFKVHRYWLYAHLAGTPRTTLKKDKPGNHEAEAVSSFLTVFNPLTPHITANLDA